MLSIAFTAALAGVNAQVTRVEADTASGLPSFALVGLPGRGALEARERVRAAIVNSGFGFPPGRLLAHVGPSSVRGGAVASDVAIALALLAADDQISRDQLRDFVVCGELALDGAIRSVPGILAMALAAKQAGFAHILVPAGNGPEAALVEGLQVFGAPCLADAVAVILGHGARFRARASYADAAASDASCGDFSDVRGQALAKRALEIAAAGGHSVLLEGPYGTGKTMLARRLPSILPPLTRAQALDVTRIYSVAGLLGANPRLVTRAPFRAPHSTSSRVSLLGGGASVRPGEATLASGGVLYLDDIGEFAQSTVEALRDSLADGVVTITRATGTTMFSAAFQLVASRTPCPCGLLGATGGGCRCDESAVARHRARHAGLLHAIDLHVPMSRIAFDELVATQPAETSATIRARVEAARARQTERLAPSGIASNARIPAGDTDAFAHTDDGARTVLNEAAARHRLSKDDTNRILRVARTIADLGGAARIDRAHLAEAMVYRAASARQAVGAR